MATQLFLIHGSGTAGWATAQSRAADFRVGGAGEPGALSTSRGSGVTAPSTSTVTGPTAGIYVGGSATAGSVWVTPPVSADVTISGAITGNLWAAENNMSANVAINFEVWKIAATDQTATLIVKSARVTEVAVTTRAVNNFTATPGAGVTVNKGDRIAVRVFGDDSGTMATGFTFSFGYSGTTAAADGDSYVSFTENFSFMSDPTGSTIYLTDTASDVATASVDREAWTNRGGGVLDDVTTTSGSAAVQITDTSGGTVVDWFTKQLNAFTLADIVQVNYRGKQSVNDYNMPRVQIAVVDADGTNPVVFGDWLGAWGDGASNVGVFDTAEGVHTVRVSGVDLAVSDGKRLRIRFLTDVQSQGSSRTSTVTTYYAGTSGGVSGDTWIKLNQSPTAYTPPSAVLEQGFVDFNDPGVY